MLEDIKPVPPDAILGLTEAFKTDANPRKINLGVGVYQDDTGKTPLLDSVLEAERRLLETEQSKSYLPIPGDPEFARAVRRLLFGHNDSRVDSGTAVGCHTPGGTGALRVGADFLRRFYADSTVWLSDPTWANHKGIFSSAGYRLDSYPYYEAETHAVDFDAMQSQLKQVPENDIVVLHACCHNPTGVDLSEEQWRAVAAIAQQAKWIPFLDFAYQGFRRGIEEDAAGLRIMADAGVECLVASSFSKNFSLYYERAGALTLILSDTAKSEAAFSHLKKTIRTNYSNPPAHGGLIVATILLDDELRERWHGEVRTMRERLVRMREIFARKMREYCPDRDFSFITRQGGIFSYSGLTPAQVEYLRNERSIYIVDSGRINIAGIQEDNIDYLCESIKLALENA